MMVLLDLLDVFRPNEFCSVPKSLTSIGVCDKQQNWKRTDRDVFCHRDVLLRKRASIKVAWDNAESWFTIPIQKKGEDLRYGNDGPPPFLT